MEVIEEILSVTAVLGVIWAIFSYVILRPLNQSISALGDAIRELRSEIKVADERRHQLEIKIAEIDQRARSAHHRLDSREG